NGNKGVQIQTEVGDTHVVGAASTKFWFLPAGGFTALGAIISQGTNISTSVSANSAKVSYSDAGETLLRDGSVVRTADQDYGGFSPTNVGTFTAGILTGTYATSDTITAAQIRGAIIYVTGAATITLPA
ncbi:unnamed protein product, partial [marine sediment metagenome]